MEGRIGEERRHIQRFSLRAQAVVQSMSEKVPHEFKLVTQDISSEGAFFPMEVPLPNGEKLKVTLFLSVSPLEGYSSAPSTTEIVTEGKVVRSDENGMAVQFLGRYLMSPSAV